MPDEQAVVLILFLPLVGFLATAAIGRRLSSRAWVVAVPSIVVTWLVALGVIGRALGGSYGDEGLTFTLWRWIPAGALQVDVNLAVHQLTAVLLFVVTTVGMLIHVYSNGYMAYDPGCWRFFAYLNLFMFSMLLLVLAGNFVLLFAGWELVGLSSYLLIGVGVVLRPNRLRRDADPMAVDAFVRRTAASRDLYPASLNKWWFDDLDDLLFVRIGGVVARAANAFDEGVVDGVDAVGRLTVGAGDRLRVVQTGRVQTYALGIAVGLIVMVGSDLFIAGR